jgi:hypothetical protein
LAWLESLFLHLGVATSKAKYELPTAPIKCGIPANVV